AEKWSAEHGVPNRRLDFTMTDAAPQRSPTPIVVWILVGVMGLVYAGLHFLPDQKHDQVLDAFAVIPSRFNPADPDHFLRWWEMLGPIFGHAFIHLAWWHVLVNAAVTLALGRYIALRFGTVWFLLLCAASAIGSAALVIGLHVDEAAIGASGMASGLFAVF